MKLIQHYVYLKIVFIVYIFWYKYQVNCVICPTLFVPAKCYPYDIRYYPANTYKHDFSGKYDCEIKGVKAVKTTEMFCEEDCLLNLNCIGFMYDWNRELCYLQLEQVTAEEQVVANSFYKRKIACQRFENQIVGCLSLKLRHVDVRRIVHVTMLGVLRQYRSRGLGRHLVNLALDQKIVGRYDAVVVHADFSACNFFKKFGFSDDALLNTQWHSLEPEYSNCSLLTLLPAYSCTPRPGGEILAEEFSAAEMEVDLRLWQQKVTEVHCFQLQAFHRMRTEIEHLKGTIKNQEKIMKDLLKELRESNKERVRLERCLKKTSSNKTNQSTDAPIKSDDEKNSSANVELKIKSHFAKSLKAVNQSDTIRYIDFIPADIPPLILAEFKAVRRSMMVFSPRLSAKSLPSNRILYFCESFSMSKEAKNKILTDGFQKEHRKPGSQGIGYYFTSNPFAASVYSNSGSIIVADVILGNTYRNVKDIQPFKDCAPEGYDSALIQPSFVAQMNNSSISDLNSPVNDSYFFSQEFVIFDAAQALPLGLINFSIVEAH